MLSYANSERITVFTKRVFKGKLKGEEVFCVRKPVVFM